MKMNAAVLPMASSKSLPSGENDTEAFQGDTRREQNMAADLPAAHTGLSALLNAVTLQLKDRPDEESSSREARISVVMENKQQKIKGEKQDVCQAPEAKTTPTMVPEMAQQMPLVESLMSLLMDDRNEDTITFLPDGKFFAIRAKAFEQTLMKQYFSVDTFESFLDELSYYGFRRIENDQEGIEVFRHHLFQKGDLKMCEQLVEEAEKRMGNRKSSPTQARKPNESLDDHYADRSDSFKRRLSPSHAGKVNASHVTSRKLKTAGVTKSSPEEAVPGLPDPAKILRKTSEEDYREAARHITTERLNLKGHGHSSAQQSAPLQQQAVADATRTIVTDAIESLLRDENHTRTTFHKHEGALSQSTLPGLVPISKQLFSSKQDEKRGTKGGSMGVEPAVGKPKGRGRS